MDNFLKHFKEEIMVVHQQIGVPIVGTWVNRATKLIYLGQDLQRQTKKKEFQTAVTPAGVKLDGNVAKMEVRDAESALLQAGSTAVTAPPSFHTGEES